MTNPPVNKESEELVELLAEIVDEFGGTLAEYHRVGPHFTHKDGTEVFDVAVILDRAELIERGKAILALTSVGGDLRAREPSQSASGEKAVATFGSSSPFDRMEEILAQAMTPDIAGTSDTHVLPQWAEDLELALGALHRLRDNPISNEAQRALRKFFAPTGAA